MKADSPTIELFEQIITAQQARGFPEEPLPPQAYDSFYLFNEAEICIQECPTCEHILYPEDLRDDEECPECGDSLINMTIIEGEDCVHCHQPFDMWDEFYIGKDEKYYCKSCHSNLVEEW